MLNRVCLTLLGAFFYDRTKRQTSNTLGPRGNLMDKF